MDLRKITDVFTVSPQIVPEDVAEIAALGFKSIICNRPDGEEMGQCEFNLIENAAHDAGLKFACVPITSGSVSQADMEDFHAAVDGLPNPILAYCRTGTRCTMLWCIAQHGKMENADIVSAAADAGYDMAGLVGQLSRSGQ